MLFLTGIQSSSPYRSGKPCDDLPICDQELCGRTHHAGKMHGHTYKVNEAKSIQVSMKY